jgi:hypothetical protein
VTERAKVPLLAYSRRPKPSHVTHSSRGAGPPPTTTTCPSTTVVNPPNTSKLTWVAQQRLPSNAKDWGHCRRSATSIATVSFHGLSHAGCWCCCCWLPRQLRACNSKRAVSVSAKDLHTTDTRRIRRLVSCQRHGTVPTRTSQQKCQIRTGRSGHPREPAVRSHSEPERLFPSKWVLQINREATGPSLLHICLESPAAHARLLQASSLIPTPCVCQLR